MNKLTEAAAKAKLWTERRDALICEARAVGHSLREIAEWAGMSHQQVDNIAKRETP